MTWRALLLDGPVRIMDGVGALYWPFVAVLTLLCFINVALWLLAYLVGLPLP